MKESSDTRTRILDAAQDLIQRIGANAMSYQHISEAVGIRKASIHHHFPKKEDLLEATIQRYSGQFFIWLDDIALSKVSAPVKLQRYIDLFGATLEKGRHDCACPIGMLGAEVETLGTASVTLIQRFRKKNEAFLAEILHQGLKEGQFKFPGDPADTAALVFVLLEGEILLARGTGGVKDFARVSEQLVRLLKR
ncbi:MAG TPA: TetR/AcrR family transcriptional regulator [Terriglobales bacterium]|nr:TetR/AcrR family transcriptional regulator [Terriglobales bacterium]